jgi:uncharacterized protein (TIGR00661 family)
MKILYGIQGTGNGHISRAREIIPYLEEYGEVDLLISGTQVDIPLKHPIAYRCHGLGYAFGKAGNIDIARTITGARPFRFLRDISALPIHQYDFVVNDFEPISAWAGTRAGLPVIALSHQASFLSKKSPRPARKNAMAEGIFKHYAPCSSAIGFHFKRYDHFIHKPIIRSEIRALNPSKGDHITVYLPAYDSETLKSIFSQIPEIRWEVFSKYCNQVNKSGNITERPVDHDGFIRSLESCQGVLTGGGFEAPSEALYLGKMLMVVPMNMQYEQQCNAKALKEMGVPVLNRIDQSIVPVIRQWLKDEITINVQYDDKTRLIIEHIMKTEQAA